MDTETGRKATRDALEEAARESGREPAVVQGNFDPRLLTDDSSMSEVNVSDIHVDRLADGKRLCSNKIHSVIKYVSFGRG